MGKVINENNKYPLIILIIACIFVSAVALAIVFSKIKFNKPVDGTVATVLYEGDLAINYIDGNEIEFNDTKEHTYGITLINSGNNKIYYSLFFSEANKDNITVTLKDNEDNVINSFNEDILNNKIIKLNAIEGAETIRYKLVVKGKDNTTFKGTIKVINESLSTELFSDILLLNNDVSITSKNDTIIGSEIATTDEGLKQTNDSKGVAYYFRGNVENNYVKLGDNMFRIVRINGDSTIRLVLDGVLEEKASFNTNGLVEGQEIAHLAMLNEASLIHLLSSWMEATLSEYYMYLADGDFCTDTVFNNTINGINYSATYDRIYKNRTPDLVCEGTTITSKVGLLSVDDVVFAGAADTQENNKYYLYNENIGDNYLTMSSLSINGNNELSMINVLGNGAIGSGQLITNVSSIRPVINIGVSAKVKGTGTKSDPYIIVS